jgi:ectoine hydroxylase-related dioxygenase (phytanoyl-CoA dioxygenase family)
MGPQSELIDGAKDFMSESLDVFKGVKESFEPKDDVDCYAEEITRNGHTVVENVLNEDQLQTLRQRMDELYEKQTKDVGGEEALREIGDSDSVKHLLVLDELFLPLLKSETMLSIVNKFLGDYFILNLQNGILNRPKVYNPASLWHRDLFYQHYSSSRPLAISTLFCIDDFTEETGGTFILPGSHKHDVFPSPSFALKHQTQLSVKAGALLIFDSMMFHRCGYNNSSRMRRSISQIFTLPPFKQQISLPKALAGKYSDDPFYRKVLGYDSETADSLEDWRSVRMRSRVGTGYSAAKKL